MKIQICWEKDGKPDSVILEGTDHSDLRKEALELVSGRDLDLEKNNIHSIILEE